MLELESVKDDWLPDLGPLRNLPIWKTLGEFLLEERSRYNVFPAPGNVFRAFSVTPKSGIRVVIVGQDPYHRLGQADGLAFSVNAGTSKPPSLRNIFKELYADVGIAAGNSGDLTNWANRGVFLLNTVLTVREHAPGSHRGKGWETITDTVLMSLSDHPSPIAFILWGNHAQEKRKLLDSSRHLIIESPHPSPFSASRGFFGSQPFSKVNNFLYDRNLEPIDWHLHNV